MNQQVNHTNHTKSQHNNTKNPFKLTKLTKTKSKITDTEEQEQKHFEALVILSTGLTLDFWSQTDFWSLLV